MVGLFCVAWPASLQLQQGSGLAEAANLRQLQVVRDNLIYYDEVLTNSARICALSGRTEFLDVYLSTVDSLDANLAAVNELQPDSAEEFVTTTAAANEKLIELETYGLRGCSTGDDALTPAEAAPFVMGADYETWKGAYIYGLQMLRTNIDNILLKERATAWESTVFLWSVGIVVMCVTLPSHKSPLPLLILNPNLS